MIRKGKVHWSIAQYAALLATLCTALAVSSCGEEEKEQDRLTGFEKVTFPNGLTAENADLSIEGKTGRNGPVYLDLKTVMAMPVTSFETHDPWDEKRQKYTGVSLIDLLEFVGIDDSAESVEVIAANDYEVSIRLADLRRYQYLLAYMIDDVLLVESENLEKKGKLMVEINFSGNEEIDIDIYKNQLVWQVKTVIVR
ncbi:MAG TPA: hypothetical protein ENI27_09275 [bacterium]|nr:hypothetical protein [bacterium]